MLPLGSLCSLLRQPRVSMPKRNPLARWTLICTVLFVNVFSFAPVEKAGASLPQLSRGECVGSGSCGTVYTFVGEDGKQLVGKRAWSLDELTEKFGGESSDKLSGKASRCKTYWQVEKHCFNKLKGVSGIPTCTGCEKDSDGDEWILFEMISGVDAPCVPSLQDVMQLDMKDHQLNDEHHLYCLSEALMLKENDGSLAETLDVVMEQMLKILSDIHEKRIVHRDIKPGNILVAPGKLVLIDFGSAADMETAGPFKKNIGLSDTVAISPIYAAPELFVEPQRKPETFDCFSVGLLFCQLLFQYLDERTDAGFHQQLRAAGWNLDTWLQTELQAKIRPTGLDDAFDVLKERPGLWHLLKGLLKEDPDQRLTSDRALDLWMDVLKGNSPRDLDGSFLSDVLDSAELCMVPTVRPLHFVATFDRSHPLGLVLSESDGEAPDYERSTDLESWSQVQADGVAGEVYVQDIVPGGQADKIGVFEVGDRLQGVGELPLAEGGFEKAVKMIGDQPRNAKFVTLHFDRKSSLVGANDLLPIPSLEGPIIVEDQGVWSSQGRRAAQEDTFLLNEVYDTKDRSILLGGVFDGHLGTAASSFIEKEFPLHFTDALTRGAGTEERVPVLNILDNAWETTCQAYRAGCSESDEECVAEYDAREGILVANTASATAAAGSTGVVVALDKQSGHIAVLNCGDSRCVLLDATSSEPAFQTVDHTPDMDIERLEEGQRLGQKYSTPECRLSRWFLPVGEYDYAVSRSLEGPFATSRGIVSDADLTNAQAKAGMTVLVASDGLWGVIDTAEACGVLKDLRASGMGAGDAAKTLCSIALEKGSSDNVSVVAIYLS